MPGILQKLGFWRVYRCGFCNAPLTDGPLSGRGGNGMSTIMCERCADRIPDIDFREDRVCGCGCALNSHEFADFDRDAKAPCEECGCEDWHEAEEDGKD